jgi:hypothetical protein
LSRSSRRSHSPSPRPRARRHSVFELRFVARKRMTPTLNYPVNSGHVPSSLATTPEKLVQHPRVAAPVPVAQHAKPLRRCSCPAHYTLDSARQGTRRLAAAVILCSGVQEHGRRNASLLATSRSTRRSKNLRAESQLQPGKKRRRGRINRYGPTIDRRLRSSDEPHERSRAHRQR